MKYENKLEEYILDNTTWRLIEENGIVECAIAYSGGCRIIETDDKNLISVCDEGGSVFLKKSKESIGHYNPVVIVAPENNLCIPIDYRTTTEDILTLGADLKTLSSLQKEFFESESNVENRDSTENRIEHLARRIGI